MNTPLDAGTAVTSWTFFVANHPPHQSSGTNYSYSPTPEKPRPGFSLNTFFFFRPTFLPPPIRLPFLTFRTRRRNDPIEPRNEN